MKTILITGIGKGIGKALAEKFLAEGFAVIGTVRIGADYADKTADVADKDMDGTSKNMRVFVLDLAKPESIAECAQQILATGEKIDILINNAGVLLDDEETKLIVEKLRDTLEVNLIGTVDFAERIIPLIAKGGHIVNISSQAGSLEDIKNFNHSHAPLRYPAYKISKAALNMYTRTLALRLENEGTGIIVSSVHPGWVKTGMGGDEAPTTTMEAAEEIFDLAVSRPESGEFWFNGEKFPW